MNWRTRSTPAASDRALTFLNVLMAVAKKADDTKLAGFQVHFSGANQMPTVRGAQARLGYLAIDPEGSDGMMGPGARAALPQSQKLRNLPRIAGLDVATDPALIAAAGV